MALTNAQLRSSAGVGGCARGHLRPPSATGCDHCGDDPFKCGELQLDQHHHLDSMLNHIINPEAFDDKHILTHAAEALEDDAFTFGGLKIEDRWAELAAFVAPFPDSF